MLTFSRNINKISFCLNISFIAPLDDILSGDEEKKLTALDN